MTKVQIFSGSEGHHNHFLDALLDYLEFYETRVKPELIRFAQEFKSTVQDLTTFLALEDSDELQETVASLLKFSSKHSEFTSKLLEEKRMKMRKIVAIGQKPNQTKNFQFFS